MTQESEKLASFSDSLMTTSLPHVSLPLVSNKNSNRRLNLNYPNNRNNHNYTSKCINFFIVGIDFKIKTINIDGKNVKLQIWDTAGQERFRTITQTYYKGAMGIILAYDCTSEDSFNNVRNWVRQIEVHASSNVEKILIGNKADLTDKKVIDTEQGMALAKEFGMAFFETSARSGHNVNETFYHISKQIKDKQQKAAAAAGA